MIELHISCVIFKNDWKSYLINEFYYYFLNIEKQWILLAAEETHLWSVKFFKDCIELLEIILIARYSQKSATTYN